jgi:hypothetical protein
MNTEIFIEQQKEKQSRTRKKSCLDLDENLGSATLCQIYLIILSLRGGTSVRRLSITDEMMKESGGRSEWAGQLFIICNSVNGFILSDSQRKRSAA